MKEIVILQCITFQKKKKNLSSWSPQLSVKKRKKERNEKAMEEMKQNFFKHTAFHLHVHFRSKLLKFLYFCYLFLEHLNCSLVSYMNSKNFVLRCIKYVIFIINSIVSKSHTLQKTNFIWKQSALIKMLNKLL